MSVVESIGVARAFNSPFLTPEIVTLSGRLNRQTRAEYLRLAGLLEQRLTLFRGVVELHREVFEEIDRMGVPNFKLGTYCDDLAHWVESLDSMMGGR